MKNVHKLIVGALVLVGISVASLSSIGLLTREHKCGSDFSVNKVYKVSPKFVNNGDKYEYQIGNFDFYKLLQKESPDKYPAYVLKQHALTMFDTAYDMCKELDLSNDRIDYLVTEDAHETLAAHILYFLSDVGTFDHYHRLVQDDIKYGEKDKIAPDLEVYGKDGSIYSFIFNDDNTKIASMAIHNDDPDEQSLSLLKDYYISNKLSFKGIKDAGYVINGRINESSFNVFILDRTKYVQGTADENIYDNKTFYSQDMDGNIVIINKLPEFHMMFMSGEIANNLRNNPHASVYNTIVFE